MSIAYPLRIDDRIIPIVELRAKDEYIDKSAALRKMLYQGVEDYVIGLYSEGRLSIGKVSEVLDKTIYDVQRLINKKGIKISYSQDVETKSKEHAQKLFV